MALPVPTRRGAAVLAAAAVAPIIGAATGGLRTGSLWLLLLATDLLVLTLALIDVAAAPAPSRLVMRRDAPHSVTVGHTARVVWRVEHRGRFPTRVRLVDDLAPSLGAPTREVTARVRPGDVATMTLTITPTRRGRFRFGRVGCATEGPLGLAARRAEVTLPHEIRVLPVFHSRDAVELLVRRARVNENGRRSARGLGGGTEFEQLREYTLDDELRRVDWAATARAGRPIVRTFRAERNQQVVVLVDRGRAMAGRVDGVPRLEWAIDAALAVSHTATRLGDRCGLMVFDATVGPVVTARAASGRQARLTETLFDVQPVLLESDYAGAFADALARFRRRSLIIVLTDLVEQSVLEYLLPAVPVVSRRHLLVVGAVTDPTLQGWASDAADGVDAVYRKAAATATLAERGRAAARLRAAGVRVVDAAPARLGVALAETYLDIKGAGRL